MLLESWADCRVVWLDNHAASRGGQAGHAVAKLLDVASLVALEIASDLKLAHEGGQVSVRLLCRLRFSTQLGKEFKMWALRKRCLLHEQRHGGDETGS